MKVEASEIKAILQMETTRKILLIFDGYDEYTEGSNAEIDEIILNGRENCIIIVSSRSGEFLEPIRGNVGEEVRITGFSYENIIKCTEQYLGSEQLRKEFLLQAERAGIHGKNRWQSLLHVPIILLMACTVFNENSSLPSNKTGLFGQIVHMSVSRTTLKTMGKTASELVNLHQLLVKLGKLAWTALTRDSKQLLIYKVRSKLWKSGTAAPFFLWFATDPLDIGIP